MKLKRYQSCNNLYTIFAFYIFILPVSWAALPVEEEEEVLITNYTIDKKSRLYLHSKTEKLKSEYLSLQKKRLEVIKSFKKTTNTLKNSPFNQLTSTATVQRAEKKQQDQLLQKMEEVNDQHHLLENFLHCLPALVKVARYESLPNQPPSQEGGMTEDVLTNNENQDIPELPTVPTTDWVSLQQTLTMPSPCPKSNPFLQGKVTLATYQKTDSQSRDDGIEFDEISDNKQEQHAANKQSEPTKVSFSLHDNHQECEKNPYSCPMFDEGYQPVDLSCLNLQGNPAYRHLPRSCQQVVVFLPDADKYSSQPAIQLPETVTLNEDTDTCYSSSHNHGLKVRYLNTEKETVIHLATMQEAEDFTIEDDGVCHSLDSGIDLEDLQRNILQMHKDYPSNEALDQETSSSSSTKETVIRTFETTHHPSWNGNPPKDAQVTVITLPDNQFIILKAIFVDYAKAHVTFPQPETVEAY